MTTLVMQPLKMEVDDKAVALVVSVEQTFLIFLRIFLVTLVVEEEAQEVEIQTIEVLI